MGSLMAGWDSETLDPMLVTRKRNRSLTKEEIAAYWKNKKEIEEEHIRAVSNLPAQTTHELEKNSKNSSKVHLDTESLQQLIKENGWWTKSSWAFLNEAPLSEASSNKYELQFHIAKLDLESSSKFNARDNEISA